MNVRKDSCVQERDVKSSQTGGERESQNINQTTSALFIVPRKRCHKKMRLIDAHAVLIHRPAGTNAGAARALNPKFGPRVWWVSTGISANLPLTNHRLGKFRLCPACEIQFFFRVLYYSTPLFWLNLVHFKLQAFSLTVLMF